MTAAAGGLPAFHLPSPKDADEGVLRDRLAVRGRGLGIALRRAVAAATAATAVTALGLLPAQVAADVKHQSRPNRIVAAAEVVLLFVDRLHPRCVGGGGAFPQVRAASVRNRTVRLCLPRVRARSAMERIHWVPALHPCLDIAMDEIATRGTLAPLAFRFLLLWTANDAARACLHRSEFLPRVVLPLLRRGTGLSVDFVVNATELFSVLALRLDEDDAEVQAQFWRPELLDFLVDSLGTAHKEDMSVSVASLLSLCEHAMKQVACFLHFRARDFGTVLRDAQRRDVIGAPEDVQCTLRLLRGMHHWTAVLREFPIASDALASGDGTGERKEGRRDGEV